MNDLRILFSYVCGQQHCWVLGGRELPLCQRCTGLYVGACCALILILILRPRPNALLYWMHGLFLLFMFPFGFHLVAHGGFMRTFTGALFGFGLAYYLALNPFTVTRAWKPATASRVLLYFALIAASIALLLWSVHEGGGVTALVLAVFAVIGLAALGLLTAANFLVLPATLRALRSHSVPSPR